MKKLRERENNRRKLGCKIPSRHGKGDTTKLYTRDLSISNMVEDKRRCVLRNEFKTVHGRVDELGDQWKSFMCAVC